MLGLRAIKPQRGLSRNHDGVGRDHAHSLAGGHGLVTGEDTGGVGDVVGDRRAWVVEVRLSYTVVATSELELKHITHIRLNTVRAESESTVRRTDGDDVDLLGGDGTHEGKESSSSELHFDDLKDCFLASKEENVV